MNCPMCNGKIFELHGNMLFKSKAVGTVNVPNVKHRKCQSCGDVTIDLEVSRYVDMFMTKRETDAINSLPIGEFITLNEAAEMLGVTKQAFSKNSRIRRGFIYSKRIGSGILYHKKSVEIYKKTGRDGRFRIDTVMEKVVYKEVPKYVFISGSDLDESHLYSDGVTAFDGKYAGTKNYSYYN